MSNFGDPNSYKSNAAREQAARMNPSNTSVVTDNRGNEGNSNQNNTTTKEVPTNQTPIQHLYPDWNSEVDDLIFNEKTKRLERGKKQPVQEDVDSSDNRVDSNDGQTQTFAQSINTNEQANSNSEVAELKGQVKQMQDLFTMLVQAAQTPTQPQEEQTFDWEMADSNERNSYLHGLTQKAKEEAKREMEQSLAPYIGSLADIKILTEANSLKSVIQNDPMGEQKLNLAIQYAKAGNIPVSNALAIIDGVVKNLDINPSSKTRTITQAQAKEIADKSKKLPSNGSNSGVSSTSSSNATPENLVRRDKKGRVDIGTTLANHIKYRLLQTS